MRACCESEEGERRGERMVVSGMGWWERGEGRGGGECVGGGGGVM